MLVRKSSHVFTTALIATSLFLSGCTPLSASRQTASALTSAMTSGQVTFQSLQASQMPYVRLVIAGDSIGAGSADGADPWVGLNLPNGYEVKNESFGGAYLGQHAYINEPKVLGDFSSNVGAGNCWLIIEAGTNDLSQGAPGDVLYSDNTARLIRDGHAAGFRVLVATILPRSSAVYAWSASDEGERLKYNSLVLANSAGADAIADLASDPIMGAASAPSDSSLYFDGLHPSAQAYSAYLKQDYVNALLSAGAGSGAPVPPPAATPVPTPAPSATPVVSAPPAPTPTSAPSGAMTIFQSEPAVVSIAQGQSSAQINVHMNAAPLENPFYTVCLALLDSNQRYVDSSGACTHPPQRSDLASGDENFSATINVPAGLAGTYSVAMSYAFWSGSGWQRAPMGMGSGVSASPEPGATQQYVIAQLMVGGAVAAPQPTPAPVATPAATPAPSATPAPLQASSSLNTIYSSPQAQISVSQGQTSVSVGFHMNAVPMESAFYAMCVALLDSQNHYVDGSGNCVSPPQRSDLANGDEGLDVTVHLPANASGTYKAVASYAAWIGTGWQRAPMNMGDGVSASPEPGAGSQYLISVISVR